MLTRGWGKAVVGDLSTIFLATIQMDIIFNRTMALLRNEKVINGCGVFLIEEKLTKTC